MSVKLSPRLATAVPYVRRGHVVADIGTDHAYLPISLCETEVLLPLKRGDICAIAADINAGPVARAEMHIAAASLADRIVAVKTDGLANLEAYAPTDIIIFGMGGELIASIIAAAPWIRTVRTRLILQPMTHAADLRAALVGTGWRIVGETLSREGERIYQTLCAEWDGGVLPPLSAAEWAVGKASYRLQDEEQCALYAALIDKTIATEIAARDARRAAGKSTDENDALIESLDDLRASITQRRPS